MSRQAERRLLGVLGFVAVAIVMFAAVRLLTGGPADDIAAGEASPTAAVDDARDADGDASSDRDSGVGRAPLTVEASTSTTGLIASSTTPPTTATTELDASSSTTSAGETTTTTKAAASSTTLSSTTTTVVATTTSSTTTTAVTTTSSSTTTAPVGLTAVEQDVIRLTNQLRSNPSGPLRRVAPMPGCVDDEFFSIEVDPGTGHPRPVPELVANDAVSIKLSRDWSIRMADADEMSHRSNESQSAIYSALGINRSRSSENVAWLSGYPESAIAMQLFVGWRESSTGHYCSLVAGSLTHIGVGHHRTDSGKDWATQNFYAQR